MAKKQKHKVKKQNVLLVCHGMMMFHWDGDPKKKYLTILTTQVPNHLVALATSRDAADNLLGNPGYYELNLAGHRTKSNFKPLPTEDVILDTRDASTGAHLEWSLDPAMYAIRVPYPTEVIRGRVYEDVNNMGLLVGTKATPVGNPKTLAAMRVLVYRGVESIELTDGSQTLTISGPGKCKRLYLYSEEKDPQDQTSDLGTFNQLAKITTGTGSQKVSTGLDLSVNQLSNVTSKYPAPDPPLPYCLEEADFYPLSTHLGLKKIRLKANMLKPSGHSHSMPLGEGNPVECLQGWGT